MATALTARMVNKKDKIVVLPWVFVDIFEDQTVQELYDNLRNGKFPRVKFTKQTCENLKILQCSTSASYKLMEEITVPLSSSVVQKVNCFDMLYFTLSVEHPNDCSICNEKKDLVTVAKPNAFKLLMSSAKTQASETPKPIENLKTGTIGTRFLQKVSNVLWYIDGHTLTIERESSRKFPDSFKKLLGFNRPEKSKHRKREISNLSRHKLLELSVTLKEVVQALQFVKSNELGVMKTDCLKVAHIMDDYSQYLLKTNQKMIKLHATSQSNLETKVNVKVLPITETPHRTLKLLDEKLQASEPFLPISVFEYLEESLNRKQVYDLIHSNLHLGGLSVKSVHYAYVPGGHKPIKWLRYQFRPMNPYVKTSSYYKGRIKIKMMVQKRQVSYL